MNIVNRPTAKLAFFLIGLFATFSISAGDKDRAEKEEEFYASSQLEGFIGVSSNNPLDAPSDNIFEVDLPRTIEEGEQVFLSYELYGVADHTGISRSINDQLAVGGFVAIESDEWRSQREQIKSTWLKKGKNIVRFTIPQGADYHYQVRNLGIAVVKEASSERAIIINKPASYKTTNRIGYLKGYVNGPNSDEARVQIEGVEVASIGSEFEGLLPKVDEGENWCVTIKVIFPDGEVLREDVQLKAEDQKGFINNLSFRSESTASELAFPEQNFSLHLDEAKIDLDTRALINQKQISITSLRHIDIPALDMAMVNVTKREGGYRFLPHGSNFGSEAKVTLPYDPEEIPEGYSEKDIRTFYFNETTKHWEMLPLDSIIREQNLIVSRTTHFTDMINGVLKVPESPETNAYTPTFIKNIKAADPSSEVIFMTPPAASNLGNANLSLPLKIPDGRQEVQPQMVLQYSNASGNGWMGMGWNLEIPSVRIDTRWGVPRYDPNKETETYLLNGDQLSPIAHGIELEDRSSEKRFFRRVEGQFERIIRHGDNTSNYWWEVTNKSGTRYFYGGLPDEGIIESSVLRDDQGNLAHWTLVEVRDLDDNFITYSCTEVSDVGVAGGTIPGRQLYIEEITYTGNADQEGAYKIEFTRDRELGETLRVDKKIEGRLGFKSVTADLLRHIDVWFKEEKIRSYEFEYIEGAFFKTLLNTIKEFDAAGNLFTSHEFEYFDDIREGSTYQPFKDAEDWNPRNDGVSGDFINPINAFGDEASALSGTKGSNFGFGLALTVGPLDGILFCKSNTAGGDFGYTESTNEGILSMIDIDGDGLPDKVLMNGSGFSYRKNLSGPDGENVFSSELLPISGVNKFYQDRSSSTSGGFQASVGGCGSFSGFVGVNRSSSKSQTNVYFTDGNGDQLIDIVVNGQVFFNRLDGNGNPAFTPSSAETPNPINQTGTVDESVVTVDPQELEDAIDQSPLHDVVRVWTAPYNGVISIDAPVSLLTFPDPALNTDGVRVAIQKGAIELWNTTIASGDTGAKIPTGVSNLSVSQGERIYFRVQSVFNGLNDEVNWDPIITYSNDASDLLDANNKPFFRYQASEDFLLSMKQSVNAPIDGSIKIEATFVKPVTSDNVRAVIFKDSDGTIVWERNYTWDQVISENVDLDLGVQKDDAFSFEVITSTNIDWTGIGWSPRLFYTDSSDPDFPDANLTDANGDPTIEFFPSVNYSLFTQILDQMTGYEALATSNLTVRPLLSFNETRSGTVTFSVKKANELVSKQDITVINGVVSGVSNANFGATVNDELFFEFHGSDPELMKAIDTSTVSVSTLSLLQVDTVNAAVLTTNEVMIFGPEYRQWGQFVYNGNRERADQAINEADLKLDEALTNEDPIDFGDTQDPDELERIYEEQGGYDPTTALFVIMFPDPQNQRWTGNDNLTYVSSTTISSSRMGQDDLSVLSPIPDTGVGGGIRAISKIAQSRSKSFTLGGGVGAGGFGINGSYSQTDGETRVLSDFMDMNGDRYPDIITESSIQYTRANGGLSDNATAQGFGANNLSEDHSEGITLGGTYATPNSRPTMFNAKDRSLVVGQGAGGGLSGNFAKGDNEVAFSWRDINGDGLPDRVFANGTAALNIGYKFLAPEPWGHSFVQEGDSESFGAGLGINIGNNSIAGGISLSRSESVGKKVLQDMNGDALMDEVSFGNPITVRINTGNGFSAPIAWNGANAFSNGSTTTESANVAFTACFSPILIPIKICTNPSSSIGQSASRELVQIQDINGDGFQDFLTSDQDDDLTVKRSTIDRTNFLKAIKRPLGASMTMDYKRTGNSFDQPNTIWTLASSKVFDGLEGDGIDTLLTTYEYEEGYYDRNERDFFGFSTVRTIQRDISDNDKVYRTSTQEFINSNYYEKGLLVREVLTDADGNPFNETISRYELRDVITGVPLPDDIRQNDAATAFPASVEVIKNFYEGQASPQKSTRMTYEYDESGNISTYTDFGSEEEADDITSEITYHRNESIYLINVAKSVTVTGTDQVYRITESEIDESGDITQLRKRLANGDEAVFDMTYDQFGNIISMTRPQNNDGERLTYTYEYDPEVQIYVEGVTDSYGYASSSTYDYRFGKELFTNDINGNEMIYELDDVGRIVKFTGPLEIASGAPYTILMEYHPEADIPWARTRHYDPQHPDNDLETIIFIDGLKRVIQKKKDGAIHVSKDAEDEEVMLVSGRVNYDAFSRSIENFYPITEAKGNESTFNETYDNVAPTETAYDILDRVVRTTLPDGSETLTEFRFGTDNNGNVEFSTLVTDGEGVEKESFTNVRGLTKSIREQYSQGSDLWTSYQYNAINELTQVTDDDGNITISKYDQFGRRVEIIQPDAGKTEFEYDLASNLARKQTANLRLVEKVIEYSYDQERLETISYPQNPQNDVRYTYGAAGADFNRAGRIVIQEDATGTQEFFYNPIGAQIKNVRTIVVPGRKPKTYVTSWEYDTWDRVQSMTYPDEETLTYAYNVGGKLRGFTGILEGQDYSYVEQLGYDKFEQRVFMSYGNGAETRYTYEPDRRRLKNLVAEDGNSRELMDNRYQYDNVNNVIKVENKVSIPTCEEKIGGPTEYNYQYDDLNRLTNADGIHFGRTKDQRYTLQMEYNDIYGITRKNQLHEVRYKSDDDDDDDCDDDDDGDGDGSGGGDDDDGGDGDDDDDGSSANTTFDSSDDDDDDGGPEWRIKKRTTYDWEYEYSQSQPHAAVKVGDLIQVFDVNGNLSRRIYPEDDDDDDDDGGESDRVLEDDDDDDQKITRYFWDEENRLMAVREGEGDDDDDEDLQFFLYDADNIRVLKSEADDIKISVNGQLVYSDADLDDFTTYVNSFYVIRDEQITSHYYIGEERVATKIHDDDDDDDDDDGEGAANPFSGLDPSGSSVDYNDKEQELQESLLKLFGKSAGKPETENAVVSSKSDGDDDDDDGVAVYYYHKDHLGSTGYTTDLHGEATQHVEYFAFGETFVEERNGGKNNPYLFNAKELDEEVGFYYYGERYYDPRISNWISVDPPLLDGRYLDGELNLGLYNPPNQAAYTYTWLNPVKYSDPTGECPNCITGLIGGAIGGLIGGAIEAGTQLYKHGEIKDWNAVGGSAAQGAITGAAAGFTGGASLVVTAGAAGTANVVGGVVNDQIQGRETTLSSAATNFVVGAGFGVAGKYLGDKAAQYFNRWSKIGSTGVVGENALKKLGGVPQKYVRTTQGGRYIDQLANGIAHESKVGYTTLTKSIRVQIAKDAEIVREGTEGVTGAVWHFFRSPKTGQVGASQPLLDELKKNGINYIIHE